MLSTSCALYPEAGLLHCREMRAGRKVTALELLTLLPDRRLLEAMLVLGNGRHGGRIWWEGESKVGKRAQRRRHCCRNGAASVPASDRRPSNNMPSSSPHPLEFPQAQQAQISESQALSAV